MVPLKKGEKENSGLYNVFQIHFYIYQRGSDPHGPPGKAAIIIHRLKIRRNDERKKILE